MRERLRSLYGAERGEEAFLALQRLLDEYRPRLAARGRGPGWLDQRDVVLITYGDSILEPGRSPLQALGSFASTHLADLVSTIHLLPFFPYSSDYGFSVIDYRRVNPELGSWEDLAALRGGFRLMVDFVLNHCSVQSPWFQRFQRGEPPYDRFFISVDPETDLSGVTRPRTTPLLTRFDTSSGPRHVWTTFSADQVDLNYAEPAVLLAMIEVMLSYVERGADLLRMDAVGYLWKEPGTSCIHLPQTHEVIKLFRQVLDALAPDVLIVTETNVPHADNISYFGDGRDEAQMVYQFPLAPLTLDALARGDATTLSGWAASLELPSERTTFFNFTASHDGIGVVPARGYLSDAEVAALAARTLRHGGEVSHKSNPDGSESPYELNATLFDILSDPNDSSEPYARKLDRFLCSQAIMLALAGVPGIYLHSLLGSHSDHDGYQRSDWKRDLNHGRLALPDLEVSLAEPSSETSQVFRRYGSLLRTRLAQPAFQPNARQDVQRLDPRLFAVRRGPAEGQTLLALHNVSADRVRRSASSLRLTGAWRDLLDGVRGDGASEVVLEPYAVRWIEFAG